jgi:hypothetical protein
MQEQGQPDSLCRPSPPDATPALELFAETRTTDRYYGKAPRLYAATLSKLLQCLGDDEHLRRLLAT